MSAARYLYRLLLAILLLVLSVDVALAYHAHVVAQGKRSMCSDTGAFSAHLTEHEPSLPAEMILPGVHSNSAPCIQQGHVGGFSGPLPFSTTALAFKRTQHTDSPLELRRWQLLGSEIIYARLMALYPQHGFW